MISVALAVLVAVVLVLVARHMDVTNHLAEITHRLDNLHRRVAQSEARLSSHATGCDQDHTNIWDQYRTFDLKQDRDSVYFDQKLLRLETQLDSLKPKSRKISRKK